VALAVVWWYVTPARRCRRLQCCLVQAIDSVVAQHAVAKVTGTVDGVMLVTGVLAPQEHPALALANCALHLLRISRQVRMLRCSHRHCCTTPTSNGARGVRRAVCRRTTLIGLLQYASSDPPRAVSSC